jgi:hypothetical protein
VAEELNVCSFCGQGEDEVWHLTRKNGHAICDDCVDDCIEQQAAQGVIADLRRLGKHLLLPISFLTANDIRAELSKYEFDSLKNDDEREHFIMLAAERLRKDELTKMIAESLDYRLFQVVCQAEEEAGLAEEATLRSELLDLMGPGPGPPPGEMPP